MKGIAKHKKAIIFLLSIILLAGACIIWNYFLDKRNTTALKYTDQGSYYSVRAYNSNLLVGDIVIPSTYRGKPVTSIGNCGFMGSKISSIV